MLTSMLLTATATMKRKQVDDWEEVDGCEEEKEFIGNIFVDEIVEDDDQFKWVG